MAAVNLSIIIPHYGIPELLVRCLRSIPKRDDVQVIVVDDGSPGAGEYPQKYPELSAPGVEFHAVKHQGKAGVMRNIGLEHAVGKWVLFVDADDLLTDNASDLFDAALNCTEDIVFHPCISRLSSDLSIPAHRMDDYQKFFGQYALDGDEAPFRYRFYVLHGKLFRRDFIVSNNLSFRKTRYSNDVLFSTQSGFFAKSIKVVPQPLAIVTQREGSLASSKFAGRISRSECLVRTHEMLKARHFLSTHGVTYFAGETDHRYIDTLRHSYRFCYCLALSRCLFLDWPLAKCYIRRDLASIVRMFKNHRMMKANAALKYSLMAAFVAWLFCALFDINGQRNLFFRAGSDSLGDYWMPRTCLDEGYAEVGNEFRFSGGKPQSGWVDGKMRVLACDRCYPPFALLALKPFPATWGGAWAWTVISTLVMIVVLCGLSRTWWPIVLLGSMPVLYNLERANQVALAASLVGVFLAWYRSEVRWQRIAAALAISAATCMKICPVVLGVLYLRERDWKSIGLCVAFTSALFFIPRFFVRDGFDGLPLIIENARNNGEVYANSAKFGIFGLWLEVCRGLRLNCMHLWGWDVAVSRLSQVLGMGLVVLGAWKRKVLWAVVGMLWAAGNMHYYGALYLLPVLMLAKRPLTWPSAAQWFVILCPLQFILFGYSWNRLLCNLATMGLLLTESGIRVARERLCPGLRVVRRKAGVI